MVVYASLRVVNNRYAPVSKFLIRDNNGAYSYSYTNPEASTLNIQRIRSIWYWLKNGLSTPMTVGNPYGLRWSEMISRR